MEVTKMAKWGIMPSIPLDPFHGEVEIMQATPGVSAIKGTRRIGLVLKVIRAIPKEVEGERTPFIDFWVSDNSEGAKNMARGLASDCGQPAPDEAFFTAVDPTSFDPAGDETFNNWVAGFVGRNFYANVGVEESAQFGDKNKLKGGSSLEGRDFAKFLTKYEQA